MHYFVYTYEQLISSHPKQKAIIVSGYSKTKRVKKVLKLGAGAYVKKTYTIEQLGLTVDDVLKKDDTVEIKRIDFLTKINS